MKKFFKHGVALLLAACMMVCFTACGDEEVALASRTVKGVTLDVPEDFGKFEKNKDIDNGVVAKDENALANIVVTSPVDAQGATATDLKKKDFKETFGFTDDQILEFDNKAKVGDLPAVYSHTVNENKKGVTTEQHLYYIFLADGTYQNVVLSYSKDEESSLSKNIDAVRNSISVK